MSVTERMKEFFNYVWDHSRDSFQTEFDECQELNENETALLLKLTELVRNGQSDAEIAEALNEAIRTNGPRILEVIIQISGLTRNKILQDLKASHAETRKTLRLASLKSIVNHADTWAKAGPYLAIRLRRVLGPLAKGDRTAVYQALAQATWPGYIRQQRAKESGHEAERRGALLLQRCGIPFEPAEKANNPKCRDSQINGVSFDLVVPSAANPRVCVKATVHTSSIGQYGESKDALEMGEARQMIDDRFPTNKPLLIGLIDGVGFDSNRAGLRGVLEKADEFCQFRTIWKLAVVSATRMNRKFLLYLPEKEIEYHREFLKRYGVDRDVVFLKDAPKEAISAGDGCLKML